MDNTAYLLYKTDEHGYKAFYTLFGVFTTKQQAKQEAIKNKLEYHTIVEVTQNNFEEVL